eukprot:TRINITY_DN24698_c1_g1_i1.p1 TRINITY_DN24698_c1_g1~~TRINITY_DN24698_c1_g1_i1.p1  ORF type:complete len:303 (+),score=39.08 TRINITY_DN24698_c1_g1_i1:43-909(+)
MSRASSKHSSQLSQHSSQLSQPSSCLEDSGQSGQQALRRNQAWAGEPEGYTVAIRNLPRHFRVAQVFDMLHDLGFSRNALATSRLRFRCGSCLCEFRTLALAREFQERARGFLLTTDKGSPRSIEVSLVSSTASPPEHGRIDEFQGRMAMVASPVQPAELISSVLTRSGVGTPSYNADGAANWNYWRSQVTAQMPLQQGRLKGHGKHDVRHHGMAMPLYISTELPRAGGLTTEPVAADGFTWRSQVAGRAVSQHGYGSSGSHDFAEVASQQDSGTLGQGLEVYARLSL